MEDIMYQFAEKHPIIFELILIVVSFLLAGICVFAGNILYLPAELSSSIGRILTGLLLLFVYRKAFRTGRTFHNLFLFLPALAFCLWNLFYNLSSGMTIGGSSYFIEGFITAIAPAIFEEVIFRGIFLYNLKQNGCSVLKCMLISALVFSAVHLTNIAGLNLVSLALQVIYSFVIGLVLAAVYLRNGSLLQVIFAHFLTDFSNRIFIEQASSTTTLQLILFVLLLLAETVYAFQLIRLIKGNIQMFSSEDKH